jgi:Ca2+-binding RTX toxin-like protein
MATPVRTEADVVAAAGTDGDSFGTGLAVGSAGAVFAYEDGDSLTLTYAGGGLYVPVSAEIGQIAVGSNSIGRRVAVWTEDPDGAGSATIDVYAYIPGQGRILIGGGAGNQVDPVIAVRDDGGFAIAYNDLAVGSGQLTLKIYSPAGEVLASYSTANSTPGVYPTQPQVHRDISIAVDSFGDYVVVWGDGSPLTVRRATFDGYSGSPLNSESAVSPVGTVALHPDVATFVEGGSVVAYLTEVDGDVRAVARLYVSGAPTTAVAALENLSGAAGQQVSVATLPDGRFVVVAVSASGDVVGQLLTGTGAKDGAVFTVNEAVGAVSRPSVETLPDGRFIVSWEREGLTENTLLYSVFDPREDGAAQSGTPYRDSLVGTAFDDVFLVGKDDDTVRGGGGQDRLWGEAGNDGLFGDAGADTLTGGSGRDTLNGGAGADRLDGGQGDDLASYSGAASGVTVDLATNTGTRGEAQGDVLVGVEDLEGSEFGDVLRGSALAESLAGRAGDDLLEGRSGGDTLSGDGGDDTLNGGDGDDYLIGDSYNNGGGDDLLVGGAGADILIGDDAFSTQGVDTASYATSVAGVVVRLSDGETEVGGDAEGDRLQYVENLIGSAVADTLEGSAGANTLKGGGGADLLSGLGGLDVLDGGAGSDTLDGGTDADSLLGADGLDSLIGGSGNDTLRGGADADTLIGDSGQDRLQGDAGSDTLDGGSGNDRLEGGGGNDRLVGGDGSDTLTGGTGQDVFVMTGSVGPFHLTPTDVITDLNASELIDLSAIDADTGVSGDQAFRLVTVFSGAAGEARLTFDAGSGRTELALNVDADSTVEFRISIDGDHSDHSAFVL